MPYLYIAPITLILLTFVVGSLIIAVYFSFTKYNIITPAEFNGLYNYKKLFNDKKLWTSLFNTIKITAMVVPVQILLSTTFAALIASRKKTLLGKLARAALFIPVLSSNAVIGTVWKALLNGGTPMVKAVFGVFGINPTMLLGDSSTAIVTLAMIIVWKSLGYHMIVTLSYLMSISDTYYDAARVDGAGKFSIFMYITLPLLKPAIILNTFLCLVSSMQVFDLVYTMTGGGPAMSTTTMVMYIYQLTFKNGKAGYAMTVSNVLMLIVLIMVLLQQRFVKRDYSET
ncbi:MAG: sugar ABC transporter permease [Eubacteriales bacterium]|nr:sugar ABC transporter permease [Eubacteriales bacterium]